MLLRWACRAGLSRGVVPAVFWYAGLGGSLLVLIHAVVRSDVVFVMGQSAASVIYLRGLYRCHKARAV